MGNSMSVMPKGEGSQEIDIFIAVNRIPLQFDHQKICITNSGYNRVLVMIDHFANYAENVPCRTASPEETCDHLINTRIARHGCRITFQSDKRTASVGELTKELMRRSQVAQAHSSTYHPQTNDLLERQNRILELFLITEVHQERRFYRLNTSRDALFENIKPQNPSTVDLKTWCIL